MKVSGELYVPPASPPVKEPPVTIEYEAECAQSRSECFGVQKNLFYPPEIEARYSYRLAPSLINISTTPFGF
jgi:hypothetical protein